MNTQKRCGGRDCMESIEKPGFCVWCDERMPICPACKTRCSSLRVLMVHIAKQHPEGSAIPGDVLEGAKRHAETRCSCGDCWQCRCAEAVRFEAEQRGVEAARYAEQLLVEECEDNDCTGCAWCDAQTHDTMRVVTGPDVDLRATTPQAGPFSAASATEVQRDLKQRPLPKGIGPGPRGAALAELAECGSDLATLIVAVAAGASLKLGPQRYRPHTGDVVLWRGTLRHDSFQHAEGADLLLVISQLAQQWRHR